MARNGNGTSSILEHTFPFRNISEDRSELWQKVAMFLKHNLIQIAKYVCFSIFLLTQNLSNWLVCKILYIKNQSSVTGFL